MEPEPEPEPETEEFTMGSPQSLFVVVYFDGATTQMGRYISILQLKTDNEGYSAHRMPGQCLEATLNQNAYVARFNEPRECPEICWFFSPPTSSSTLDLYMVPNFEGRKAIGAPLHGCKFNFMDRTCQPIKPPMAFKVFPHAVTCGGRIYFMADPDAYYKTPDPVFECYDPDENEWKTLEPFPDHDVHLLCGTIEAWAVWEDTILYNMGSCRIWAYNVSRDRWYVVNIKDDRCYTIRGEAVVLKNTIYALTYLSHDIVLALSITGDCIDGELVFTCSVCSEILVPRMGEPAYKIEDSYSWKRCLVHSHLDNLFLVQSCKIFGSHTKQPIQVTTLKLTRDESLTVTNVCVYWVEILHGDQFEVQLCFSLPECKTTALNEGVGVGVEPCFSLDIGYYASKEEEKTDFNPEPFLEYDSFTLPEYEYENLPQLEVENVPLPEYENVTLPEDEEGHSVIVRNLPLYVALGELRKLLINFGPIKDGIRLRSNKREKRCYAIVEFESVNSMQRAIEESSSKKGVMINGCRVIIKDKRSTELTRVDSSWTRGGSSSARGNVSRPNMTSSAQDWDAWLRS